MWDLRDSCLRQASRPVEGRERWAISTNVNLIVVGPEGFEPSTPTLSR